MKAYYVSKETSKRAEAVMTIIVDRGIGLFALLFLGAGAGILNWKQPEMRGPVLTVLLLFVISLVLILSANITEIFLVTYFPYFGSGMGNRGNKLQGIFRLCWHDRRNLRIYLPHPAPDATCLEPGWSSPLSSSPAS